MAAEVRSGGVTAVELKRTEHERPSCKIEIKPVVCLPCKSAKLQQQHHCCGHSNGCIRSMEAIGEGGSGKGSGNAVSAEEKSVDVCLVAGACLQFVKTKQGKEEKRGEKAMVGVRLQARQGEGGGELPIAPSLPAPLDCPGRDPPATTLCHCHPV